MNKFPIWIKSKGKWELIPYHLMTTFEDGNKGFYWPQIRRDPIACKFVSDNKRYFRVRRKKIYAPPPNQRHIADTEYRIILANRRSWLLPKWVFRVGLGLNLGCNALNLIKIFVGVPGWSPSYGLIGVFIGSALSMAYVIIMFNNDDYVLSHVP